MRHSTPTNSQRYFFSASRWRICGILFYCDTTTTRSMIAGVALKKKTYPWSVTARRYYASISHDAVITHAKPTSWRFSYYVRHPFYTAVLCTSVPILYPSYVRIVHIVPSFLSVRRRIYRSFFFLLFFLVFPTSCFAFPFKILAFRELMAKNIATYYACIIDRYIVIFCTYTVPSWLYTARACYVYAERCSSFIAW